MFGSATFSSFLQNRTGDRTMKTLEMCDGFRYTFHPSGVRDTHQDLAFYKHSTPLGFFRLFVERAREPFTFSDE